MSGGASGQWRDKILDRRGETGFCVLAAIVVLPAGVADSAQHPFDLRPADNPIRFSPLTAAQPLTILSWPEAALNAAASKACLPMAVSLKYPFSPCSS